MASATQTKVRSRLFCNHCNKSADKRSDLDARLLCAQCRTIPGVRGYRDPSKRGLEGGSPEYLKHNPIRNVITDDGVAAGRVEMVARWDAATGNVTVVPKAPAIIGGTLKQWRLDAFRADALNSDAKLLLIKLADHADYDTEPTPGGNCFPSVSTLAKELGWPETRVRRTIDEVCHAWLLIAEVERVVGDGTFVRTSNQYLLRWPDGRQLSGARNKRAW